MNPVAKHAHKTNKCVVFKSKKQYTRKGKIPGHCNWLPVFVPEIVSPE